jgi:hypothetical protein
MTNYKGRCFCGAIELEVSGAPAAMGYCHCGDCRSWAAAPVNAFSLWPPDAVRVTRGAEQIGTFAKTPRSERSFCKVCGGHLFTKHPHWNLIDVYAATIPELRHEATVHVHYQESVLPMRDGVTKLKDIPAEMGGSGVAVAE